MKAFRPLIKIIPAAAALAALPALATDGYFPHGYGMKALGMGGTSTALAQDSMGGATNPASMVWTGSRMDIGANVFMPIRDAERSGAGFPTLNGKVDSDKKAFLIPEFGYNRMLNDRTSAGVTVYGNGGMNTTYPQGNFNCGGGAANMLCGSGGLGVDLMQLIVAPTMAYKIAPQHSLGASLLLGYQRFKATGLQAFDNAPGFPPMTQSPGSVTNNGHASSTGVGVRLGYFGRFDALSVGASWSPKMKMGKLDEYKGLFAGAGGFDIPENYSVGIAFNPAPAWTVAADYQRINYAGAPSVGNPSLPVAPLGAANGPGFGWHNVDVFLKLGVAWQMNSQWLLRAGYNHGQNPIHPADVTFNILAPGVITSHYTFGFTRALSAVDELTAALMIAPRQSVTGASLFNGLMGPGAGGNETIRMRQSSIGVAWSRKF